MALMNMYAEAYRWAASCPAVARYIGDDPNFRGLNAGQVIGKVRMQAVAEGWCMACPPFSDTPCVRDEAWLPPAAQGAPTSAPDLLMRSADLLRERGESYDKGQERSMARIVSAFNALTGHELTEVQGWMFMQVLKNVRLLTSATPHRDSAEDCIAYAALAAEAALG